MVSDAELSFADRAGRFYTRQYGLPPVTGRLLGFLAVCEPPEQTIADLAAALRASRSAITGAVRQLESFGAVQRGRAAGDRVDRVSLDPAGLEPRGFDPAEYRQQAALAREALDLRPDASPQRRAVLEEAAALSDFLASTLPEVLAEWRAQREAANSR
jgi:DNA-binding MarR family transcriptional regulator